MIQTSKGAAGTPASLIQFANLEGVRSLARSRAGAVLLACAVLSFSVLAMHAPLVAARSMRHVSSSAKMLPRTQATEVAVAPLVRVVEPVLTFLPPAVPHRSVERESPPLPSAPVLGAASLRAPPLS